MEKQNLINKLKEMGAMPLYGLRNNPQGIKWRSAPKELNREECVIYETIEVLDWHKQREEFKALAGELQDEVFAYEIKNEKRPTAILMHPGTLSIMWDKDVNFRNYLSYTGEQTLLGMKILRSMDMEEGKFILI